MPCPLFYTLVSVGTGGGRPTKFRAVVAAVALFALGGCGFGFPWPTAPSPAAGSITVAVFGDSLIVGSTGALHDALTFDHQPNTVIDHTVPGSGLLDPGIEDFINNNLPASGVVVFEYVGMCYACPAPIASPTYFALWEAAMRRVIQGARNRGLSVVWVKPPPIVNPYAVFVATEQSAMVDRVTADMGIVKADWWVALGDINGAYQDLLVYSDFLAPAALHLVREPDAFHISPVGQKRASAWTAAAVIDAAT